MNTRLIVGLILVNGLVAYVADYLGKRLGRRRVTFLGIRPRTTAVILAIGSGLLITVVTLSALAVASRDVRIALFRIEQIQNERETAIAQRDAAVAEAQQVRQDLSAAHEELSAAETGKKQAIEARQTAVSQRDLAQTELTKTREDLLAQRRRLEEQRRALVQALAQGRALESQRKQLEAELGQLDQRLKKVNEDLAQVNRELGIREAVVEITDPTTAGRTIVQAGEQLARVILPSDSTESQIQDAIAELLEQAEGEAIRRGAAPFPGEAQRAILLYRLQVERLSLETLTAQLIQTVQHLSGDVVIIAFARFEAREGLPVLVDLVVEEVKMVLRAGTVLMEREFDGTRDFDSLANDFRQMLLDLRAKVLGLEMIPPPGGTFGDLPISRVVELIHAIQKAGAHVVVRVRVQKDARNIDPLDVRFEVAPAAETGGET